jgi:hypothetical protein
MAGDDHAHCAGLIRLVLKEKTAIFDAAVVFKFDIFIIFLDGTKGESIYQTKGYDALFYSLYDQAILGLSHTDGEYSGRLLTAQEMAELQVAWSEYRRPECIEGLNKEIFQVESAVQWAGTFGLAFCSASWTPPPRSCCLCVHLVHESTE